jgi:thiamine biosynthesis protein ThiS
MEITIIKETEQGSKKVNFSKQTVKEILEQLNINPETVLVVRNKEVITEDDPLNDQDTLEILNVVSGG